MEPGAKLAYAIESAHGWCIGEYAFSVARRRPGCGAGVLPVNTGRCICTSSGPFNFAVGLAMGKPITMDEFCQVDHFFRSRDLLPRIDVTPYTDPSLLALLQQRDYIPSEFTSTLCFDLSQPLPEIALPKNIVLRWADPSDCDVWVETVAKCFFVTDPGPDRRDNLAALFSVPNSLNVIAEDEGQNGTQTSVGTGLCPVAAVSSGMIPDDLTMPTIFASAVLPAYRNRGIHAAMLRLRLDRLRVAGCKTVAVSATPGSASERNLIRYGFVPCYEKITYIAPQ